MKNSPARAIAIPLIAAVVSWSLFMVGVYTELFVNDVYDDEGMWIGRDPAVSPATYIFFAAVAVFAIASLVGQRLAIAQRLERGAHDRAARGAHRFATLAIIIGLAISVILGISTFFEGFDRGSQIEEAIGLRFFTTYLPIILYTALVVSVILAGFVFRKDTLPKSKDTVSDDAESEAEGEVSGSQRDLGAAYALPIVAAAVALIFGLIVYDVTGTTLEVWIWVVIQILIATGVVAGTIYAERAVQQGPSSNTSRSRITRGARNLNFVLSIVFGGVVTAMAFGFGSSAIESLRISPSLYVEIMAGPGAELENVDVGITGWDLQEGSAVSMFIAEPMDSILVAEVKDQEYFSESRRMPADLEEGEYLLQGEATSIDGRVLHREVPFTVDAEGRVYWDPDVNYGMYNQEEETIRDADFEWLFEELLPSMVLLALALGGVYTTLIERNRAPRGLGAKEKKA